MYTKGKWTAKKLEQNHHDYDNWQTFTIRADDNVCLAVVGEVDRSHSEDNKANARLIAAAPELLEACEWAAKGEHHSACIHHKNYLKCDCSVGAAQRQINETSTRIIYLQVLQKTL
jgi:hypothetical protein